MLNISGLKNGVVIDHIQAGGAFEIYNYLNLDKEDDCGARTDYSTTKGEGQRICQRGLFCPCKFSAEDMSEAERSW